MVSAHYYVILSSAIDNALNPQTSMTVGVSSNTILVDKSPPTSTISFPLDSGPAGQGRYAPSNVGHPSNNTRFSGTDVDADGAGVNPTAMQLRVSYLNGSTTQYWNASNFNELYSTNAWQATNNTVWRYDTDIPATTWISVLDGTGNRQFKVEVRATDLTTNWDGTGSGNIQVTYSTVNFIVDNTPPLVAITTPTVRLMSTLSTISGTANAYQAGLSRVDVSISTNGTGQLYYWTGSTWTTNVSWVAATVVPNTSWYYSIPTTMIADSSFTAVARALDYAGNYSTVFSTVIFTIDTTSPTINVGFPLNNGRYSAVQTSTPIAGTSIDPGTFAVGVTTVQVSVVDLDSGSTGYFNGVTFTSGGPFYVGINGGSLASWTFNYPGLFFVNDHHYSVTAQARDAVGNSNLSTSVIFGYDIEIPTACVTSPISQYINTFPQVVGTASDLRFGARNYQANLGTSTVGVAFYDMSTNLWWDGANFNGLNPAYFQTVNSTTVTPNQWTYSITAPLSTKLVDGHSIRIVPRAVDLAGNAEFASNVAPGGVGVTVTYDFNPPTTTITNPFDSTPSDDTQPRISTVTAASGIGGQPTIIGTTGDGTGTGADLVQVRIWKSNPALYWQYGTDYSASAYTIDPVSAADTAWFTAMTSLTAIQIGTQHFHS